MITLPYIRCKNCNAENNIENNFCHQCGLKLDEMYCSNCSVLDLGIYSNRKKCPEVFAFIMKELRQKYGNQEINRLVARYNLLDPHYTEQSKENK